MAVTGLPTSAGVGILSGTLRQEVKKFCLFGTDGSGDTINFSEDSTLASLNRYLIGKFDVSRAYFDDNGTLTFECPIPYDFSNTKWVGACGLIHISQSNGAETLVAVSTMPRFQKTAGIGGTIHYKVPIAGSASNIVFEELPYVTRQEIDVVLNEQHSLMSMALDQSSLANREIQKTLKQRVQSGEVLLTNRGVIKGCTASKSSTATRNLSLASGTIFMHGRIISISELTNTANVPSNTSADTKYCFAYLWFDLNGNPQVDCTNFDASLPDDGLILYKITVPANSTEASDPYLVGCTLTDMRYLEPNYPKILLNAPFKYVALPYDMLDINYGIELDILSFDGGGFQLGCIYPSGRAKNGFSINMNGTADSVKIRWTAKNTIL